MGKKEDESVVYDAIDLSGFVYTESMVDKIADIKTIEEHFSLAREKLMELTGKVIGCEGWYGYGHEEMVAFLNLLTLYMDKIDGNSSPIKGVIESMESFENIMSDFEANSVACNSIKGL